MKKIAWVVAFLVCLAGGFIIVSTVSSEYNRSKPEILISTFLLVIAGVLVAYVFARAIDRIIEK